MKQLIPQCATSGPELETYFAMAVHDLKTPVTAQILATEYLLKNGEFKTETSEMLTDILASAKYLKNIVENILTKYRVDMNTMNIRFSENSIEKVVEDAIHCSKYILDERDIELEVIKNIQTPTIKFDYLEIKRVLNNLLTNSAEHSKCGNKIILQLEESENYIKISVQDFGCGINLKNPYDIFKKDLTLSKEQKRLGNGLGLYISKEIIDAHNGKIDVETKLDKGTKISFQLPKNL